MGHTCLIALIYLFGNVSQYKFVLLSISKFEFNARQYYFLLTLTKSFDLLETLFRILTYTAYIASNRNVRFWLIAVNTKTGLKNITIASSRRPFKGNTDTIDLLGGCQVSKFHLCIILTYFDSLNHATCNNMKLKCYNYSLQEPIVNNIATTWELELELLRN